MSSFMYVYVHVCVCMYVCVCSLLSLWRQVVLECRRLPWKGLHGEQDAIGVERPIDQLREAEGYCMRNTHTHNTHTYKLSVKYSA